MSNFSARGPKPSLSGRAKSYPALERLHGYYSPNLLDPCSSVSSFSHDLVHRDLKPDNIMFQEDGVTPMVVDFGLVRDLSSTSITGTWLPMGPGTPYYSAPEQLNNDKELINWRTDQFALGVLLTECILGYHPYSEIGDDPARVVGRVAQKDGPTDRFKADVTRLGLPLLIHMTAPWPVARYRMPEDLAQAWQEQEATA
jgi:serine/threonine protein kinase